MKKKTNKKGITLIALVITIILLLILAGITISLTIGHRGILERAQEAGKNYQKAAKKEEEELTKFDVEAANIIAGINSPNTLSEPKYTMVDGVPVPKGFQPEEGTSKDTGFVIKDNSGTETAGNEFVWIPCTIDENGEGIKYDRYAFSKTGWNSTQTKDENTGEIKQNPTKTTFSFNEAMSDIEKNSIKQYGGFYMGRYEVGIVDGIQELSGMVNNYTAPNGEWTGWKNGKAVVQQGKQVWNYITRNMAITVSEDMYKNSEIVTSRLCSSYAWDTTLKFIETKNPDYGTNSTEDNHSGNLKDTGAGSTQVNSIYDMGGNVYEWTTETCDHVGLSYVGRGGYYTASASDAPAGLRGDIMENLADSLCRISCYFVYDSIVGIN